MNNNHTSKNLFGISSSSSSGSSGLYVDLLTNQSINGVKSFLSNLITNNDVNFNTTGNIGRIVFKPNEPAGFGGNLLSIYTTDENDTQGWNFDADGNLYYLGIGLSPIKIIFEPNGNITAIGNISSANVLCDTIQSFSGGNITINNNLALGSNTILTTGDITGGTGSFTTGSFSSNVNITGDINTFGTINCGNISAGSGTISTTGPINVGSINATSLTTGSGPIDGGAGSFTTGAFTSNVNITGTINCGNISAGSGTISTTGPINVGSINATSLNTSSGPITGGAGSFTTGAFSSNVNITGATNGLTISGGFSGLFCNKIESQSGGAIVSSAVFNLRNALAVTNIVLDPLNTIRLKINGITGTNSYLFFNNSNLLGFFNTSTGTNTWSITDLGAISCNSITASTSLTTNLINASTGTNKIQMDNRFFNTGVGSIDLKSTYIGFPQLSQTLSTASKYMAIIPATDGNFTMSINNIASRVLVSDWVNLILFSEFNQRFMKEPGNSRILMFNTSTSGDIFQICRTGANAYGDGYWYHNNTGNFGYISSGIVRWEILNTGGMNLTSDLNISNRVIVSPAVVAGEIMTVRITAGLEPRFHFSTNSNFGFWSGTAHTYYVNGPTGNITTNGSLTCGGNIQAPSMNITNNTNNALILVYGGIHLQNNNWLFGRCKFGDADYAYIAEYDTGDSDKLYLFGSTGIYCNTLPVVVSDKRLKENIEDFIIDNPLEIIDKIRLVEYNRIDNPSKTRVLGYIAQEILEIFPKAVEIDQTVIKKDENSVLFKKHKDGTDSEEPEREERLALNYSYISMLNTEAIKQLNELVQKQQTLIDALIKRIEILEKLE